MVLKNVNVTMGEQGEVFLKRNQIPEKDHVDRQPAGINFYNYRWNTSNKGAINFEHGKYSFEIPYAVSITGSEDSKAAGFDSINISSGFNQIGSINHEEARNEFIKLIDKLSSLGWKPYLFYNHPRLLGKDAFQYYLEDESYSLPLDYIPTLPEWMNIGPDYWRLYADGVFLEIKFYRDKQKLNISEPGSYLLAFRFRTAEQEAKDQFEGNEREHWRDFWVDKIKILKKERYGTEAGLIKRGFTIYTGYEEPKIHPADPVEP